MFRPENLLQVALRKTEILSFCLSLLVSQGAHPGRDGAGTQPAASAQPESSAPAGLGPGRGEPSRVPVGAAVEEPSPPPVPTPTPPYSAPNLRAARMERCRRVRRSGTAGSGCHLPAAAAPCGDGISAQQSLGAPPPARHPKSVTEPQYTSLELPRSDCPPQSSSLQ